MNPTALQPLLVLRPTEDWLALPNDARLAWLEDKLAELQEFQTIPNGVWWVGGASDNADDAITMLWNLVDTPSVEALVNMMKRPEVIRYFSLSIIDGRPLQSQEDVWRPFLRKT